MTVELFGNPSFGSVPRVVSFYIVWGPMAGFRQIWAGVSVQTAPLAAVVPCEMVYVTTVLIR